MTSSRRWPSGNWLATMREQVKSMDFDLRRRQRDTRFRPWLTNSVLQGRSSGLDGSEDAPELPESTTVAIVSDLPPSTTGKCVPEEQGADNTKKEQANTCLSKASAAGSKIPQWVGLEGVLSRTCYPLALAGDGARGKGKATAVSPTVTGEKTFASRLPVRVKSSFAGCWPSEVQPSNPLDAHTESSEGKEVGTTSEEEDVVEKEEEWFWGMYVLLHQGALKPIQNCFKPEPIKSHRTGRPGRSILKHRAELSDEAKVTTGASAGAESSKPVKKSVLITRHRPFTTPARHWGQGTLGMCFHKCCWRTYCNAP
ncbi:hypothetical protein LTR96_003596 [Exophiala xenobiotica]|nr:hypothetical protein LTR47_004267 [Exophiala xenobiotica]KAK5245143.1 hypothetical protein LTS06_009389 [Exophiala xenobiotica]KAK5271769.1 hypothetical protein LTR96_003596 [Exophiala xenobiotica]KAK5349467.1 hypothetical protein LTR61_006856 [Exophiala xenobiotica]KAK5373191.1 hypothetical protein LTR11_005930 [Exophiala xenobiotica]